MTYQFVVRIGYHDYAVDPKDVAHLLEITSRMKRVGQNRYTGPYYIQADQEPLIDTISMREVRIPEVEQEPDVFGEATRETSVI